MKSLNEGPQRKLTLLSAPAGFGKTTVMTQWLSASERPGAWLSLDEEDNDPSQFLAYLVAALQTVAPDIGKRAMAALQSPQPPRAESILTELLNEISERAGRFTLVLDDFHAIDAAPVDKALTFLIEHLPAQVHLVIVTREDPRLPLARLRARGQLTELRAADLRFTPDEAAAFLNNAMGLDLSTDDVAALETRTEGWIAGLQLAAISLQGQRDATRFIHSFTGSHRFVLDYLVEEVLEQQPERIQTFLLRTSILDRLCGPLCDAVVSDSAGSGRETLTYLERANLFLVPLDNERRWYRYHHLFADLLRQRLLQGPAPAAEDAPRRVNELHIRASQWYEDNGLAMEAFHHAAAANDIQRAERLIDGKGIPLHFRGAVARIVEWLASLPATMLDARPWLWWRYASLLLVIGQTTGVAEKLDAAEAALQGATADEESRRLAGRIAAARAVLALSRYQPQIMIAESRRALEYLPPEDLSLRANANWTLGYAYIYLRDVTAAHGPLTEAVSLSQASGNIFTTILATIGLGNVEEAKNRLSAAAEIYRRVLDLAGDQPLQIIHEPHLGLARIFYQWNDLDAAERHGQQALQLAQQYDRVIDRFIVCEVFLAHLKLALGNLSAAAAILAQARQSARRPEFVQRLPEVAAAEVLTLLSQGDLAAAAHLAQTHDLPLSQARVYLVQGDAPSALAVLARLRREAEEKRWADEQLRATVLQAVALQAHGEKDRAVQTLGDALALAEPGGFIRIFIDEGLPMAQLLSEAVSRGIRSAYAGELLMVLEAEQQKRSERSLSPVMPAVQPLTEPLSQRELEVLQLLAHGLSNREVGERLFLALDTVKGHNRSIFGKLEVHRRIDAVARARELGLL